MSIDIDAIPEEIDPALFDNIGEQTVRHFLFHIISILSINQRNILHQQMEKF